MHDDAARSARAIFDADRLGVERLHQLLLDERAALATRDVTRLEATLAEKLDCLKALGENESARTLLLKRVQVTNWAALLGKLDPPLLEQWQSMQTRLREVAELGEVNERIVNRARRSTSRLLALLRGQTDTAGVYDRAGRTRAYGDNRPIARA